MLSLTDLPIVNLVQGSKFQIIHLYGLTLRNSYFRQTQRTFPLGNVGTYFNASCVNKKDVPLEC